MFCLNLKNLKSNHHLIFLPFFRDLESIQFWSVNHVCQVCKLYFLGWTEIPKCPKLWTIFLFGRFWWQRKCSACCFFKIYVFVNHYTRNRILLQFLEAKSPCDKKIFKIFLYLFSYFFQKITQLILEKLPQFRNGWS